MLRSRTIIARKDTIRPAKLFGTKEKQMLFLMKKIDQERRSLTGERGGLLLSERGGEALERVVVALRQRHPPLLVAGDDGRQHLQVVRLHHLQAAAAAAARRAPHVDDIRLNRQHHRLISMHNSTSLIEKSSKILS